MRWGLVVIAVLFASGAAAEVPPKADGSVRFATFNTALNERKAGGIVRRLETRVDKQARMVAEVVQRVRPDVLLVQELDRDLELRSLDLLRGYFARGENGADGIDFPYAVFPPSNTGVLAGVDIDGDGKVTRPGDAKGFGFHEGQYAFALLSRMPLEAATTYGDVLWRDVPGNLMPLDYYAEPARAVLPLSSKTHLSVPVATPGGPIRVLAAHPTPPVFDDARDWNGRRNSDEIRMLVDMLGCGDLHAAYRLAAEAHARDAGAPAGTVTRPDGGIDAGELRRAQEQGGPSCAAPPSVVMGDLNADANRGDSLPTGILALLGDERIADAVPTSLAHGERTADFNGGMRVDYVLPTRALEVTGSGVFWPADEDPLARLNDASDHHLVWVDVRPR